MRLQPPADPSADLQVWRVGLDVDDGALAAAQAGLSMDERAWSERLRQPAHRRQFIVTRAALRRILGAALAIPPQSVVLATGSHGKPRLDCGGPHFNLSHSGALALIALCRDHPVGIDVEQTCLSADELDDIANLHFSASEQAAYLALPPIERTEIFYRIWTRKEAVAKALGLGMSLPGPSFDVSPYRLDPRLLRLPQDIALESWSVMDLDLGPSYTGAVAVRAAGLRSPRRGVEVLPTPM